MKPLTVQEIKENWKFVPWCEPVQFGARYACRICNVLFGLHPDQIDTLPTDRDLVVRHIQDAHKDWLT